MSDDFTARSLLLAGMRVTGSAVHLGTLYGWLVPITVAARTMPVCVLVADHQSLDIDLDEPLADVGDALEAGLREFLPASVSLVRESAVPSLPTLALLASTLFAPSDLRRVAPLRALQDRWPALPLSTVLFPALMVADALAFEATHVLEQPEWHSHQIDMINKALQRGATRFGWPDRQLERLPRQPVDIRRADGSGPMRRNRGDRGMLSLAGATLESVRAWTTSLPCPGFTVPGSQRRSRCATAWGIWDAVPGRDRDQHHAACLANELSCPACTGLLATRIVRHLDDLRSASARRRVNEHDVERANRAEASARTLVRRALEGSSRDAAGSTA